MPQTGAGYSNDSAVGAMSTTQSDPDLTSYEVRNLIEHLVRAGRQDAVHRLLALEGPQGPTWYELKQRADDDLGYERDVEAAWRLSDAQFREAAASAARAVAMALQLRYALIAASLGRVADALTPRRLRRRVTSGEWSISHARATAARASDPTLRAQMFAALMGLGDSDDDRAVVADALADPDRATVLAAVSERLAREALPAVAAAAQALRREDALADALVAVAGRLPAEHVEPWLREAMRLESSDARARAVVALASRAPAGRADELVLEGRLLDHEQAALELLEAVAPNLSPGAAELALQAVRRLPAERSTDAGGRRAAGGDPAGQSDERAAGRTPSSRSHPARDERAAGLAALGLPAQALQVAAEIRPSERGPTIVALAPQLTPALASKALALAAELPSAPARCEAVVALAPIVEGPSMLAALKIAESLKETTRARALHALGPRVPEARLGLALRLALSIRDVEARGVALAPLEPRLTDRHRATPAYRRRAVSVNPAEVLQRWSASPATPRAAPAAAVRPAAVAVPIEDGEVEPDTGVELDADALRHRLIDAVRTEQSDYAALRSWLVEVLSTRFGELVRLSDSQLSERLASSVSGGDRPGRPPPDHGRRANVSETTLRRHLREQLAGRHVDLSDARVQAALEVVDPITIRTALHLGLGLAEHHEHDYDLFDGRYDEAPTMVDAIPVFADHGRLPEALAAARDLAGPYRRAEALAAALPHLAGRDRVEIAGEAAANVIAACRGLSPRLWWRRLDVLGALAPVVSGKVLGSLAAELRTLGGKAGPDVPPDDSRRAIVIEAQLLLMLHVSTRGRSRLAIDALAVARRIGSKPVRAAVLDVLIPSLPAAALDTAARTARTLPATRPRATALAAVARRAGETGAAATASELVEEIARPADLVADPLSPGSRPARDAADVVGSGRDLVSRPGRRPAPCAAARAARGDGDRARRPVACARTARRPRCGRRARGRDPSGRAVVAVTSSGEELGWPQQGGDSAKTASTEAWWTGELRPPRRGRRLGDAAVIRRRPRPRRRLRQPRRHARRWDHARDGQRWEADLHVARHAVYMPLPPGTGDRPRGRVQPFVATTGSCAASLSTRASCSGPRTLDAAMQVSPTVAGDLLITGDVNGRCYAIDGTRGTVRWSRRVADDAIETQPAVAGGTAFVPAHDGLLYAVDVATGKARWPAVTNARASVAVSGDTVLAAAGDRLVAIDPRTGERRWRRRLGSWGDAEPATRGGAVVVSAGPMITPRPSPTAGRCGSVSWAASSGLRRLQATSCSSPRGSRRSSTALALDDGHVLWSAALPGGGHRRARRRRRQRSAPGERGDRGVPVRHRAGKTSRVRARMSGFGNHLAGS